MEDSEKGKVSLPIRLRPVDGNVKDERLVKGTHAAYLLFADGFWSMCCLFPTDRVFSIDALRTYVGEKPEECFYNAVSSMGTALLGHKSNGWVGFKIDDETRPEFHNQVISHFRHVYVLKRETFHGPGFSNTLPADLSFVIRQLVNRERTARRARLRSRNANPTTATQVPKDKTELSDAGDLDAMFDSDDDNERASTKRPRTTVESAPRVECVAAPVPDTESVVIHGIKCVKSLEELVRCWTKSQDAGMPFLVVDVINAE